MLRLQWAKKLGWLFLAFGGRSSREEWQLTAKLGEVRRHFVHTTHIIHIHIHTHMYIYIYKYILLKKWNTYHYLLISTPRSKNDAFGRPTVSTCFNPSRLRQVLPELRGLSLLWPPCGGLRALVERMVRLGPRWLNRFTKQNILPGLNWGDILRRLTLPSQASTDQSILYLLLGLAERSRLVWVGMPLLGQWRDAPFWWNLFGETFLVKSLIQVARYGRQHLCSAHGSQTCGWGPEYGPRSKFSTWLSPASNSSRCRFQASCLPGRLLWNGNQHAINSLFGSHGGSPAMKDTPKWTFRWRGW